MKARVGHEVAHRLLAMDAPVLRLMRYAAGSLYSHIMLLIDLINNANATLSGSDGNELTVVRSAKPHLTQSMLNV